MLLSPSALKLLNCSLVMQSIHSFSILTLVLLSITNSYHGIYFLFLILFFMFSYRDVRRWLWGEEEIDKRKLHEELENSEKLEDGVVSPSLPRAQVGTDSAAGLGSTVMWSSEEQELSVESPCSTTSSGSYRDCYWWDSLMQESSGSAATLPKVEDMISPQETNSMCSSAEYYSIPASPLVDKLVESCFDNQEPPKTTSHTVIFRMHSYEDFVLARRRHNNLWRSLSQPSSPTGTSCVALGMSKKMESVVAASTDDTASKMLSMQNGTLCQVPNVTSVSGNDEKNTSDSVLKEKDSTTQDTIALEDKEQDLNINEKLSVAQNNISPITSRLKRPDRLHLSNITSQKRACRVSKMASECQENVVKECWIEEVCEWEELSMTCSTPGESGEELISTAGDPFHGVHKSDASTEVADIPLYAGTPFTGFELVNLMSSNVTTDTPSNSIDIIRSLCTQLVNLGVLHPVTSAHTHNRASPQQTGFQLNEKYKWAAANAAPFYEISQDQKLKKLRQHNTNLKSRLNQVTEKLNRLDVKTENCKCVPPPGSQSPACQIEVLAQGKTRTSVSLPSTVLSISTFNASGSHVSLSFNSRECNHPNCVDRDEKKYCTNSPLSCDSFKTAPESLNSMSDETEEKPITIKHSKLSNQRRDDSDDTTFALNDLANRSFKMKVAATNNSQPSQQPTTTSNSSLSNQHSALTPELSPSFTKCAQDSNVSLNSKPKCDAQTSVTEDMISPSDRLCTNCQQLMTARSRFSNASIDSGLSQSCNLTGSESAPVFYTPTEDENMTTSITVEDLVSPESSSYAVPPQVLANDITDNIPPPPPPSLLAPPPPPPPLILSLPAPRKKKLKPRVSLKPLHWQRILLRTRTGGLQRPLSENSTVWEKLEEPKVDIDELEELFSLDHLAPKILPTVVRRKNFTKVLDRKRSQNLGIVLSSIRQPFSEIKKALINYDVSFLAIDTWRAIYDARATEKELTEIQDKVETNPRCVLDKPEQFLYSLNNLQFGIERIKCFLLRSHYEEVIKDINCQLDNMAAVCDHMTSSSRLENLLSLLLAVGNYLNGANENRGQADGFSLDILPKLKGIRGKNQTTLLNYIAIKYRSKYGGARGRVDPPLPSTDSFLNASTTCYGDLSSCLNQLGSEFSECQALMGKVETTLTDQATNQTFYDVMTSFINQSTEHIQGLHTKIETSQALFLKTCQFFSAPTTNCHTLTPSGFFEPWLEFTRDLNYIWSSRSHNLPSRASAHF